MRGILFIACPAPISLSLEFSCQTRLVRISGFYSAILIEKVLNGLSLEAVMCSPNIDP